MTIPYPTKERAIRSLLAAPLLPIGILFLLDAVDRAVQFGALAILGAALLAFYMLIVVELFTLVLGGAALGILWRRVPFNSMICILVGGVVATLPFLIFGLISSAQEPIDYNAWVDGQATVVNGMKTSYGLGETSLRYFKSLVLGCLAAGSSGGFAGRASPSSQRSNDR